MINEFNKRIRKQYPLSELFDKILEKLDILRIMSAPNSFELFKRRHNSSELYYRVSLVEFYFHTVINTLEDLDKTILKYLDKYPNEHWRKFAMDDKLEAIEEYGGEDEDYTEEGTVKSYFSDDELIHFSFPSRLRGLMPNIVSDTQHVDLSIAYNILENENKFNAKNILSEFFNTNIETYSEDENGDIKKVDWAEERLIEAQEQFRSDTLYGTLKMFMLYLIGLVNDIKNLDPTEDNKDVFVTIRHNIERILNLNLSFHNLSGDNCPF